MKHSDNDLIDPDPFILANLCLQGAAVILQLVQISQTGGVKKRKGAITARKSTLSSLEAALEDFDLAIEKAERMVRRNSAAPEEEFYQVSFRLTLGVLRFSADNVAEYHRTVAEVGAKLSALTLWIGHIIEQDSEIVVALGKEIVDLVHNASQRLNNLMADGAPIETILAESKQVRNACKASVQRHLDAGSN